MIGTEDNFIKTLLSKYNEGIDNIINEDSEAFNNITNNGEFENNSLFGEENEITETNTITETIEMKKDGLSHPLLVAGGGFEPPTSGL